MIIKIIYDALNRLIKVIDAQGMETIYNYDGVGNKVKMVYPNGIIAKYDYDKMNRLRRIEYKRPNDEVISFYDYIISPSGNKMKLIEENGRMVEWSYDDLDRLVLERITEADNSVKEFRYTYDAVGNRLSQSINGNITTYSYDANDRLLTEVSSSETISYTWDNNGNMLSKTDSTGISLYYWDYDNRLIEAQTPNASIAYTYDTKGIRMQSNVNNSIINYFVDPNQPYAQVLKELDASGSTIASYTFGDDLLYQKQSDTISFYLYDAQYSSRYLIDAFGYPNNKYNYDAFGNILDKVETIRNIYLYTGEQYDSNLDAYYLRARYLLTKQGRFMSRDPKENLTPNSDEPFIINAYAYANNNPIKYIDYSGEWIEPSDLHFGRIVHEEIYADFEAQRSGYRPITNRSIKYILPKCSDNKEESQSKLRPDLVTCDDHEVYEIKSIFSSRQAYLDLFLYLEEFHKQSRADWHPGMNYWPFIKNEAPVFIEGWYLYAFRESEGVILYARSKNILRDVEVPVTEIGKAKIHQLVEQYRLAFEQYAPISLSALLAFEIAYAILKISSALITPSLSFAY